MYDENSDIVVGKEVVSKLPVREQFFVKRCKLEFAIRSEWIPAKRAYQKRRHTIYQLRKLLEFRRQHPLYGRIYQMALLARKGGTLSEMRDTMFEWLYYPGGKSRKRIHAYPLTEIVDFVDAEMEIEGLSESQIRALLMAEDL